MEPKKVFLCSEFTCLNTGYASYYREIAWALYKAGHEVVELAGYGDSNNIEHIQMAQTCPWPIYLNIPDKRDEEACRAYDQQEAFSHDAKFGSWQFDNLIMKERPDIVISIRDPWYDKFIVESPLAKYITIILSPTVDAKWQRGDWLDIFKRADVVTSYNKWAEDALRTQYSGENLVEHIPPAPNSVYKPINKEKCRATLGLPLDKKILLTVMRNQGRKRFPELFEAFSALKRKDAVLYCHTHHQDRGWDIAKLLLQCNVQDKVYFTYICKCCNAFKADIFNYTKRCEGCSGEMSICSVVDGIKDEDLNIVYNSCDLYVQYSSNEGMGIPQLEAAAAGKKTLAINYSAQEDINDKLVSQKLNPLYLQVDISSSCKRAVPNNKEFTDLLDQDETWEYSEAEVLSKLNEHYGWTKTGQKWVDLVESITPKNKWFDRPNIKEPVSFEKIQHLDNVEFVKACISYVAHMPELLGSYIHGEMLDHLQAGHFIPEDKFKFQKAQFMVPIQKKSVYDRLKVLRERTNVWERKRLEQNQLIIENH